MKKCTVTVTSSLGEDVYDILCSKTRKKFGEDIIFNKICDDSIIGGFILDIEGEVFDLSISSQLKEIKKHIKEE